MATKPLMTTLTGKVPAGATHFELYALTKAHGTNEKTGKKYNTWRCKRLKGDANRDGVVTQHWPLSELNAVKIRQRWGAGRYRIRYVNEAGDLLGAIDVQLETPPGEVQGGTFDSPDVVEGGASSSPASRLRGVAGRLDGGGVVELMLLLNEASDRAAARARDEADRNADRDRQFFNQMQAQQTNLLAMFRGPGGAAAGGAPQASAGDLAREMNLLRREMALSMREEMARLREELGGGGDDDDDDRPETAGQALDRAGVSLVEGLGEEAPGLVTEGLGALRKWLRSKGQATDPAAIAAVLAAVQQAAQIEAQAAQANGAGGEHDQND